VQRGCEVSNRTASAELVEMLRPNRYSGMSPRMAALVGYVLGQAWTNPLILDLAVTTDGCVLAQVGEANGDEWVPEGPGYDRVFGDWRDVERNWNELVEAANLPPTQADEAMDLWRRRVAAKRRSA